MVETTVDLLVFRISRMDTMYEVAMHIHIVAKISKILKGWTWQIGNFV